MHHFETLLTRGKKPSQCAGSTNPFTLYGRSSHYLLNNLRGRNIPRPLKWFAVGWRKRGTRTFPSGQSYIWSKPEARNALTAAMACGNAWLETLPFSRLPKESYHGYPLISSRVREIWIRPGSMLESQRIPDPPSHCRMSVSLGKLISDVGGKPDSSTLRVRWRHVQWAQMSAGQPGASYPLCSLLHLVTQQRHHHSALPLQAEVTTMSQLQFKLTRSEV